MKKQFNENNSDLAEYVARKMRENNLSGYEVQRRSGNRIAQSYINHIKNGEVKNPTPEKLKVLAIGLGVTEEELFSVVRGKTPNTQNIANEQFQNLNQIFEKLPKAKMLHAQILIDMIEREFKILANEK